MMYDPSGRFPWLIILVAVAIVATVNDIYEITREDNGVEATASGDNVHIKNSSKIITPWVKLGYSIYLNHFNEKTKDAIDGSSFGVFFEWQIHDLAYYGLSFIDLFVDSDNVTSYKDSAQSVDVGKTIYSDDHGAFSWVMWGLYIFSNPVSSVVDLFIHF